MVYIIDIVNMCKDPGLAGILLIIKKALSLIQIIGPIIAILSLVFISVKFVANPENKKLKGAIKNWVIALMMLFFIPVLVNATMGLLGENFTVSSCWKNAEEIIQTGESEYKDSDKSNGNEDTEKEKDHFIVDPDEYTEEA